MPEIAASHAHRSTCAYCAQVIAPYPGVIGTWVADDGWGSICGDAPEGAHVPVTAN